MTTFRSTGVVTGEFARGSCNVYFSSPKRRPALAGVQAKDGDMPDGNARARCLQCVNGDVTELSACINMQCPDYSQCRRRQRGISHVGEPGWTPNDGSERSYANA